MKSTYSSGSGLWKHGLLLTLLFGFTVMLVGGFFMYKSRAPIPDRVLGPNNTVLFTGADIQAGQELFRKRDLMNYGSILGHGAYLGPDYTAEALHWMTEAMQESRSGGRYASLDAAGRAGIDAAIAEEFRTNRYDAATGTLPFTSGQALGFKRVVERYGSQFRGGDAARALPKGALLPAGEGGEDPVLHDQAARQFAAFITWTAWLSTAKRPEANHSYTNNWPYDPSAGNGPTAGALLWSAVSVAGLVMFLAVILYFHHRYRLEAAEIEGANLRFDLNSTSLTPSQRATAKFFVVALLLFLV
jgi:nitric oxide reductase subunit B